MSTVPPSYLCECIVGTNTTPSVSLHIPAELKTEGGKLVVMLEQKWYSLIRPWITRYQRLRKKYKRLPAMVRLSWIPSVSFSFPEGSVGIGLGGLLHWIAEGWMKIGCIADPVTITVNRETGNTEVDGNGVLTSK